jgi:glycosyltransferase involved in cell wall biosynthesis
MSSSATRVSIVLASFNGAQFIEEQIRSLLPFLDANDELVISDDASTDGTAAVARSISDSRIRVLDNCERVGYQANFERAIRASAGQFIFFSDQDDRCLPKRISESLAALGKHAVVFGDATLVDSNMNLVNESYFSARPIRSMSSASLFIRPVVIGATMACRREFLLDVMPFPKGVPHDHWISVLAAFAGQLGVVRQPFILYRRHASAASSTGMADAKRPIHTIAVERWRLLRAAIKYWMK